MTPAENLTPGVAVLPGLDGARILREQFAGEVSKYLPATVIGFPRDSLVTFEELTEATRQQLPAEQPMALIAESFSGPVALRIAVERPHQIYAVVLVATFAENPVRFPLTLVRYLVHPLFFRMKPPLWLLKLIMVNAPPEYLVPFFRETAITIKPEIMAGRLREAFKMDATQDLLECPCPILHVAAKRDRILWGYAARKIVKLRPDIETRYFDSGHCVLECWPAHIALELKDFLLNAASAFTPPPRPIT